MSSSTEVKSLIYQPPTPCESEGTSVFLAGSSIEMGKAVDWQENFATDLSHLPISIFNPRRKDFFETMTQDISNPLFKEQVDWELEQLSKADVIALFLQPETRFPISLLELGLYAKEGKLVVCCPEGFWRRGTVQIICDRYQIPLLDTTEELKEYVVARLKRILEERAACWEWRRSLPVLVEKLCQALAYMMGMRWHNNSKYKSVKTGPSSCT